MIHLGSCISNNPDVFGKELIAILQQVSVQESMKVHRLEVYQPKKCRKLYETVSFAFLKENL